MCSTPSPFHRNVTVMVNPMALAQGKASVSQAV
jgi:hypothetical protein